MKKYTKQMEAQFLEVYCNCCGRQLRTQKDMILEGAFPGHVQ